MVGPFHAVSGSRKNAILWALTGLSAAMNLTTGVLHDLGLAAVQAAAMALPLVLFAFVHGSLRYQLRDLLVFAIICIVVSNIFENLSILTGFPFGRYHYTEMLGPRIVYVPVLIGPVYFAVGYLAWTLAHVILRASEPSREQLTFTLPLVASFILVAWNFSFDPLASTVKQFWIWSEGGSYFGVPLSNFLGWYLTGYVFFQLYALYLRYRGGECTARTPQSPEYWLQAILVYGTLGATVILSAVAGTTSDTVADEAGVVWRISEIYSVCALVCLFTMGTFTLLGMAAMRDLPGRHLGVGQRQT
jgi:uncharacterized membrane protein